MVIRMTKVGITTNAELFCNILLRKIFLVGLGRDIFHFIFMLLYKVKICYPKPIRLRRNVFISRNSKPALLVFRLFA
ncbi:MAG: hypothetical protein DID89_2727546640 [Candidatus Nitrotoga sp. CP45]|nr:MAG: hypothetical protein DID89_2727546640 [Candidatus Nitrotoga sp. CP45]